VRLTGDRAALGPSEDLYYRYERWSQQAESDIGSMVGVDGALYAIRRSLFVSPPPDTILDDMAIPMGVIRAGYRVVFEPAARAYEQGSASAREEFARKIRVTAGAVQFLSRSESAVPIKAAQIMFSLFSHKVLRWLSPALGGMLFITSIILASSSPGYTAAVVAETGVLLVGLLGCVPAFRRAGVIALVHYFCLVQAAAAVGFLRGVSGRQSVLWQRFGRVTDAPVVQS
jgi:cellulose synthase/poly-beta-1,6-N-acetylglucosamine synthase-like glycosyltransferase